MTHRIDSWQRPPHVKAVQTTRNLGNHITFDMHPKQSETRLLQQLQTEFGLPHQPYLLQQIHGNRVVEYKTQPDNNFELEADACYTRNKNTVCAVMTADCLPVLLTDSAGSFVAAVHCGWRSLYAEILSQTLQQINPNHQVLAWFGPAIQQAQYQVDKAFVDHYLKQHPNSFAAFTEIISGKSYACLKTLAQIQLNDLGVIHIEASDVCTCLNPDYYSWRQNNSLKRTASMVWMS